MSAEKYHIPQPPAGIGAPDNQFIDNYDDDDTVYDPGIIEKIKQDIEARRKGGAALDAAGIEVQEVAERKKMPVLGEVSEPAGKIAEQAHDNVERWLEQSSNIDADREKAYMLASELGASERAKKELAVLVPTEFESLPNDAEEADGLVKSIKRRFEQIGGENGMVRTAVDKLVGEMMDSRADRDELVRNLRQLEGQVESWVESSGRARGEGDNLSDFSNKVFSKANNVGHHVQRVAANFRQDKQEIYDEPSAQEGSELAQRVIAQTDAQSTEELEYLADNSNSDTNQRFDLLDRGARELQAVASQLINGDIHDQLQLFPRRTGNVLNVLAEMRVGLQNGNIPRVQEGASYLREQLQYIERSVAHICSLAGEDDEKVDIIAAKSQAMIQVVSRA